MRVSPREETGSWKEIYFVSLREGEEQSRLSGEVCAGRRELGEWEKWQKLTAGAGRRILAGRKTQAA